MIMDGVKRLTISACFEKMCITGRNVALTSHKNLKMLCYAEIFCTFTQIGSGRICVKIRREEVGIIRKERN